MLNVSKNLEEMNATIDSAKSLMGDRKPKFFGIARLDMGIANPDAILQCNFLTTNVNENEGSAAIFLQALKQDETNLVYKSENEEVYNIDTTFIKNVLNVFEPILDETSYNKHLNVNAVKVLDNISKKMSEPDITEQGIVFGKGNYTYRAVFIYEDAPVETVEAGYLKLYALSEGKSPIRSLNLDGIFGLLTNCAWLNTGEPVELEILRQRQMELKAMGHYPKIMCIDKFPPMLQHVIPADNTRILDTSKVRMGAQLAAGTTVMPGASYINFNAGTLGPVMVEGRISSSAIVGSGSDIGGGASILGVLSGTDGDPISIGEKCLLGANSVTGISLGDGCIVDAGATVLANTPVFVTYADYEAIMEVNKNNLNKINVEYSGSITYAKEWSGMNGLHFRLDVNKGRMILKRSTREIKLNKDLH